MTEIRFYHMKTKRLEQALPEILAKALEKQYRIIVKAGSRERIENMDKVLWTYQPDSFLPHGMARDGFESRQPVFLTTENDNPNNADVLILTDGAESQKIEGYKLCCEIFDGNDETATATARSRWMAYKDAGHDVSYFQQTPQGKWEKK